MSLTAPPSKTELKPTPAKPPDIAPTSVPDTLATLKVNPDTGLARGEVDILDAFDELKMAYPSPVQNDGGN